MMPVPDGATVGGKECQTLKINTSVGELELCGQWLMQSPWSAVSEQGVSYNQCWLQLTRITPALSVGQPYFGLQQEPGPDAKSTGLWGRQVSRQQALANRRACTPWHGHIRTLGIGCLH